LANSKLPALMFYPGDWMKDPAVRAATIEARGLWIDLLCLMHESPKRGYLSMKNGSAMSLQQISRVVGTDVKTCKKLLAELDSVGVCSVTESGVIYSRRMARDQEKRTHKIVAGKRGGRIRVANEREARRSEDPNSKEAKVAAANKYAVQIWKEIPATARKNRATTLQAISQAIGRCAENGQGTEAKAVKLLSGKVKEYYASQEGCGQFRRSAARWFDEDGFTESPKAWKNQGQLTGKF
jgi:hypothetical protein